MGKAERRFYEPLVLLETLDRVQGERLVEEPYRLEDADIVMQRREVLKALCKMCDHTKGGDTVTAMALQVTPAHPIYWVASSENVKKRILPFLNETLALLSKWTNPPESQSLETLERQLFVRFTDFHRPRLGKTRRLLQKHVNKQLKQCLGHRGHNQKIQAYVAGLNVLLKVVDDDEDHLSMCQTAHENGHDRFMGINYLETAGATSVICQHGSEIRHYIGRMGATLRAAKLLAKAPSAVPAIFEDFQIRSCRCGGPINPPNMRGDLKLDLVASRMLEANSRQLPELQASLASLDRTSGLGEAMVARFKDSNFRPRVHAELAVLESIFEADIEFYDGDRYIACSKGACFCCFHYISHHPGMWVRPQCHNKMWLNWRAPEVSGRAADGQRRVMQKVTDEVRNAAMAKVRRKSGGSRFRPDSTSGITPTMSVSSRRLHSTSVDHLSGRKLQFLDPLDSPDTSSADHSPLDDASEDGGVALVARRIWGLDLGSD